MDMNKYGWIWLDIGGYVVDMGGYGWICMDMGGYGWIWVDAGGYGWIWMDMGGYGSIWLFTMIPQLCPHYSYGCPGVLARPQSYQVSLFTVIPHPCLRTGIVE